jgi:AraC-like DNA-binding protein
MTPVSQPSTRKSLGTMNLGSVQARVLGSIASARGVRVVAFDGMVSLKTENQFTTSVRALSHLQQMPANPTMSLGERSSHAMGAINYVSPGLILKQSGNGPITGAMCAFEANFFASLAETEDGFNFDSGEYFADVQSERMAYLGRSMFREAVAPSFAASLFVESIGLTIQLEMARYDNALRSSDGVRRGGLAAWQMRRVEDYVGDNLSADITLDGLARLIGISVRQLSRAVRQEKGVGVHRWVANRRLSEARRLLMETDMSIGEVARRCAFHSSTAFAAAFRAASDFSPVEFRRLHLE